MNALKTQKQLLIAESDLNRAAMREEVAALTTGVRAVTARAKSFGSIASAGTVLIAGLTALRRGGGTGVRAPRLSWVQRILKNAGLVSTLWLAFRSQRRDAKKP